MYEAQSFPGGHIVVLCSPVELIAHYYYIVLEILQPEVYV